jgi:hypothetical protein
MSKFKIEKPFKLDERAGIVQGVNCDHWQYQAFNKL